jgi:hypothetical protein
MANQIIESDFRNRLNNQVRGLFGEMENRLGRSIGFNGSIMEQMLIGRAKPFTEEKFNMGVIDKSLLPYVDPNGYFRLVISRGKTWFGSYSIDCVRGNFFPCITMPTQDGSLNFKVQCGSEVDNFSRTVVTRYFDKDEKFSRAREIQTYDGSYSGGNHQMIINERVLSQQNFNMAYDLTENTGIGDVEVAERSMVYSSNKGIYGVLEDKKIKWQREEPEKVVISDNEIVIENKGDFFKFPIRTNILSEIASMVIDIKDMSMHAEITSRKQLNTG